MYQIIYSPVALLEYKEAVIWYKERSKGAADNFVKEIREKSDKISNSPLRYRIVYKHFRQTSLKKYPYSLLYFIDEKANLITITSVFHHKRNPKSKFLKK